MKFVRLMQCSPQHINLRVLTRAVLVRRQTFPHTGPQAEPVSELSSTYSHTLSKLLELT